MEGVSGGPLSKYSPLHICYFKSMYDADGKLETGLLEVMWLDATVD